MPAQLPTRKLGKNGPEVTALGLGLMGLSAFYGPAKPDEERFAVLDHVYESGCLNWDSSDLYGDNEDVLGKWFKRNPEKREHVFLATKFAFAFDPATGAMSIRNDPEYIQQAIDKSLSRLGLPYVDLYYCHRLDANQPVETTVAAMKKLQDAGKVKYLGLSECSAEALRRASAVAHIDAVQVEYSPWSLDIESAEIDLLRTCRELGVAVVAYSPLGRGFLSGKYRSRADFDPSDSRLSMPRFAEGVFHKNLELVDTIQGIAKKKGSTAGQLTLAWLLAQGDHVIPIPGTTKVENLDENLGALKLQVSKEEDDEIRQAIAKTEVAGDRYDTAFSTFNFVTTRPL